MGDLLVAVGQQDVQAKSVADVRAALQGAPGSSVTLRFTRKVHGGARLFDVTLRRAGGVQE